MDIANIITIVTGIIALIAVIQLIATEKRNKRIAGQNSKNSYTRMSDYDIVKQRTAQIENDRQKNSGEHFEDEQVFIARAERIRTKSDFFKYINNRK